MTRTLRVAVSGWFAGRSAGSGQYVDALLAALEQRYPADDYALIPAPRRRGGPWKLGFELVGFPASARGYDVAHVPYWSAPWLSPAPVVVTVHDVIPLVEAAYRRRWGGRRYTALVARSTRRARGIIVDSKHTAAQVRRRLAVAAEKVVVVPLGVDDGYFHPEDAAPMALPEAYGLYLGGFDPRKNLGVLFAAWRRVYDEAQVPLVVAGSLATAGTRGHPRRAAREAGLAPPAVQFLGHVAEAAKPGLYAGARVFAYPSIHEGFGLPPLEAMAAGAPVVAARATSLPEVVGEAGLLVPAGDSAAWAEAVLAILGDAALAADLRARGRARARGFTWAATAEATRQVYDRVARGALP